MSRSRISLITLSALLTATITPGVDACGTRSRRATYSPLRSVHVVRPVSVVRPVTVVQPTLAPITRAPRPVPPAAITPPQAVPTVPAGATMTLPANFLGEQPGSVFMVFEKIKLPVEVSRWTTTGVTITLPPMAIKDAVVIRVDIVLPNGKLGHTQSLRVTAPAPVVLHPVRPTSPLPSQPAVAPSVAPPAGRSPAMAPMAPRATRVQPPPRGSGPANPLANPLATAPAPQSPIVLPPADAAQIPAAGAAPQMQGKGTPDQPFVLPTAQPLVTDTPAPQSAVAPAVSQPGSEGDDAWLEDNPILQEGLQPDPPAELSQESSVEATPETTPPTASLSAREMTTVLSALAQILLAK